MLSESKIKLIRTDTTLDLSQKAEKNDSYATRGRPNRTDDSQPELWVRGWRAVRRSFM
jgi:hypothetical protein